MNNSFSSSIAEICGLELATLLSEYKYAVYGSHTVVIEGHVGIGEYGTDTVSFAVKKGVLRVNGENLRIKCLEKRFAVVVGRITSVEVKSNEK